VGAGKRGQTGAGYTRMNDRYAYFLVGLVLLIAVP